MPAILSPPVFADEEKTQRARALYVILWTLLFGLTSFGILYIFLLPENTLRMLAITLGIDASCLILLALTQRGATRLASILTIVVLWFFITSAVVTAGGVY